MSQGMALRHPRFAPVRAKNRAAHCMLDPGCAADFAEQTAAAALRALGLDARNAEMLARRLFQKAQPPSPGLFPETVALSPPGRKPAKKLNSTR
jgi:hypothetical protein